jgi:hypothetical protein
MLTDLMKAQINANIYIIEEDEYMENGILCFHFYLNSE